MKRTMVLAFLAAMSSGGCFSTREGVSETQACELAKRRTTDSHRFPAASAAFCDHVAAEFNPAGYYVLSLHSDRDCDGICSTNLGWFAVQRSTGEVFDWDMAESKLGSPVTSRQ
ncbi:hypothetical protein [Brevundimonas sp. 374]|uniref:hypothetical protein n=1 Tax=Brevundimonas sp. 374 TaxID=1150400 RepID=UPI00115FE4D8|nr:hypothetical protein [Brevundimonas sp. 374]